MKTTLTLLVMTLIGAALYLNKTHISERVHLEETLCKKDSTIKYLEKQLNEAEFYISSQRKCKKYHE
jgi:5-bromo-4-chloroindolyl phosphate hydrolysis protein